MRILFGMILGAAITVGGAYLRDSMYATPTPSAGVSGRPMVNWDVVGASTRNVTDVVREQWSRLTGK
jgi:hypothetical protein